MYTIGSVIKHEREKRKISQEELCFGICAVSTLSRIEHNEQTPSMEKAMALLDRLGLEGSAYLSFVSNEEYEFYKISRNASEMLSQRQYLKAYEYINKNKKLMEKNKFRRQLSDVVTAVKTCFVDRQYETAISMTEEAIRYTCPQFDKSKKIRFFMTDMEVNVINVMAVSYWWNGERITALNLMISLTDALREQYSMVGVSNIRYPMILCNLAKWLNELFRFEEAKEYIELGRDVCVKSGKFRMLPYLCCCRATALQGLKHDEEEVLKEYISAYIMFLNMGISEDAVKLRSYLLEFYNRDLECIGMPEFNSPT